MKLSQKVEALNETSGDIFENSTDENLRALLNDYNPKINLNKSVIPALIVAGLFTRLAKLCAESFQSSSGNRRQDRTFLTFRNRRFLRR